MPQSSAHGQGNFAGPHPLALRLLRELPAGGRVLEIGPGSGRNTRALQTARATADSVEADPAALGRMGDHDYHAVLSTHAMLHGTPPSIEALVRSALRCMKPGARLYTTFGSIRDARFGAGKRISAHAYAPFEGDEAGVAHSYFNEDEVRELTAGLQIVSLEETAVDHIAGTWAHPTERLTNAVHWFVVAEKKRA